MNRQRITPFAALEKRAFLQGIKDMGNGMYNSAAGAVNAGIGKATQGLQANTAGVLGALSGNQSFNDAKTQQWNQTGALAADQQNRSEAGKQQMYGNGNSMLTRATNGIAANAAGVAGALSGNTSFNTAKNDQWNRAAEGLEVSDSMANAGKAVTKYHPGAGSLLGGADKGEVGIAGGVGSALGKAFAGGSAAPTQMGPPASAANPPKAIPVDQMARFKKMHGTAFDPLSKMDRGKMNAMGGLQPTAPANPMLAKAGSLFARLACA